MASEKEDTRAERRASPRARGLVRRELARALGSGLLLPPRAFGQLGYQLELAAKVREDLASEPSFAPDDLVLDLPERPLRIFVSCAEASGETHAVNLVAALRSVLAEQGAPEPELVGLGGERLRAAGVRTVGDPVRSARMGISGVLGALPFYLHLLEDAADALLAKTDLYIGVDSPALHVPLAHIARGAGVPTVQYITPQYWGWAPWRVKGFRHAVDRALSILPFEPAWFARHGVAVEHVGHPLLDELETLAVNEAQPRASGERKVLAVLPGSRRSVIERNLPQMLRALRAPLERDSAWELCLLQSSDQHLELLESCVDQSGLDRDRVRVSRALEDELGAAEAALSVSGTILIHLLRRRLPTVVLYRLASASEEWLGRHFLTVPFFSSVNLLAGREVYPEFSFAGDEAPEAFQAAVERLLGDADWRAEVRGELEVAAKRLGPPGASRRAALASLACVRR